MSTIGKIVTTQANGVDHDDDLVERQARLSVQGEPKNMEDMPLEKLKKTKQAQSGVSKKHNDQTKVFKNCSDICNPNRDDIEKCNAENRQVRHANPSSEDNSGKKAGSNITKNTKDTIKISNETKPMKVAPSSYTDIEITNAPKSKGKKTKGTGTKKKLKHVQDQEIPVKKQTSLTDHYRVRRSERNVKTNADDEARIALEKKILSGIEDGLEIQVLEEKGRGIFSTQKFPKGSFICEYAGELIDVAEARAREEEYEQDPDVGSYMYFFAYKEKKYCVDATKESDRLGRLLNHSKTSSNVTTKLFPINNIPYLILVASQDIGIGEELLYDYGDRSKKALESHPWLKS